MKLYEIFNSKSSNINNAFWRWFGNSDVVDKHGNPLVVYHGTNQTIDKFLSNRLGKNTGSISSKAFFFTDHPIEAGEYAGMSARKQVSNSIEKEKNAERLLRAIDRASDRGDYELAEKLTLELEDSEQEAMSGEEIGANILPVYLSIQNPLILDMESSVDLSRISDAIDHAKINGYDGIRLNNVFEVISERPDLFNTTQWIVFKPNQIKSVFNIGTWKKSSPHLSETV